MDDDAPHWKMLGHADAPQWAKDAAVAVERRSGLAGSRGTVDLKQLEAAVVEIRVGAQKQRTFIVRDSEGRVLFVRESALRPIEQVGVDVN
jgi:hypothetical protein